MPLSQDFNYRVQLPRALALLMLENGREYVRARVCRLCGRVTNAACVVSWCLLLSQEMLKHDQLTQQVAMHAVRAFKVLTENPPCFPPSYKFDVGTNCYDSRSKKARVPAWTDRILHSRGVKFLYYNSLMEFTTSDHKPVVAGFEAAVMVVPSPRHTANLAGRQAGVSPITVPVSGASATGAMGAASDGSARSLGAEPLVLSGSGRGRGPSLAGSEPDTEGWRGIQVDHHGPTRTARGQARPESPLTLSPQVRGMGAVKSQACVIM